MGMMVYSSICWVMQGSSHPPKYPAFLVPGTLWVFLVRIEGSRFEVSCPETLGVGSRV